MKKIITTTIKKDNPGGGQLVLSTAKFNDGYTWRHGALVFANIKIIIEFNNNNSIENFEVWDKKTNRQIFDDGSSLFKLIRDQPDLFDGDPS